MLGSEKISSDRVVMRRWSFIEERNEGWCVLCKRKCVRSSGESLDRNGGSDRARRWIKRRLWARRLWAIRRRVEIILWITWWQVKWLEENSRTGQLLSWASLLWRFFILPVRKPEELTKVHKGWSDTKLYYPPVLILFSNIDRKLSIHSQK